MAGSIQAVPKLQKFIIIMSKVTTLLLIMGCGSPAIQEIPEIGQSGSDSTVHFDSRPVLKASYPTWFWNTPTSKDNLFAIGLSETFAHEEASEERAIANGVENLAKSLLVSIKGEYGIVREGGRVTFSGNDMQENMSSTMHSFVEKHHQVVAKCVTPTYTFVLLRLGENGSELSVSSTASTVLPKDPPWVTSLPMESGYMYASGQSNPYYRETNSWRAAEEHARIALALNLESKVRGLAKELDVQTTTGSGSNIITVSTDVELNRVQVVARWKHPEYNTCHVLVRTPLSANTEAITGLVRSVLVEESQEEVPQKSREERIQEVFDELDRLTDPEK